MKIGALAREQLAKSLWVLNIRSILGKVFATYTVKRYRASPGSIGLHVVQSTEVTG